MSETDWLAHVLPQGATVTVVVVVAGGLLFKYIPALIVEFKAIAQGLVDSHATSLKEERAVYQSEMREARATFTTALHKVADQAAQTTSIMADKLQLLSDELRDLRDDVRAFRNWMEK